MSAADRAPLMGGAAQLQLPHTPGPWAAEIADYGSKRIGTVFAGSVDIARIVVVGGAFNARTDANARLIAAAPELLLGGIDAVGALQAAADIIRKMGRHDKADQLLQFATPLIDAINKATVAPEAIPAGEAKDSDFGEFQAAGGTK